MKHDEIDVNELTPETLARLVLAQRAFIGVKTVCDAKLAQMIDERAGTNTQNWKKVQRLNADLKAWRAATAEILEKYDQSIAEILGQPSLAKGH